MSQGSRSLVATDLTKTFTMGGGLARSRIVAVNQVNFALGDGGPEILALAGESGSGKTTVARMTLGLVEPSAGAITWGGRRITSLRRRRARKEFMRHVQPVFQNPFETFSPLERVYTYLHETARNLWTGAGRAEAAIGAALESVGLSITEVAGKYPNEFSGGQLQRTAIARALISDPSLLVADEPVSMVDASMRMSIVNLFKELKTTRGLSVLYITHDLATAYYAGDRVGIMLRGSVVEMGTVETVLGDPLHPYTRLLLESVPEPDTDRRWTSEIALSSFEDKEFALRGCKFAGRCPRRMQHCATEEPREMPVKGRMVRCHLYDRGGPEEQQADGPQG